MILLHLYYEFFITGLFIFGGGLAAIPFLQQMSERTGWFTIEQLMDMVAVSESTPGPISVNMATYAGYMTAGIPGGIVATLGLITPSIIIAIIVARLLRRFKESELVNSAFYGLRPASLGLIAAAGLIVLRLSLLDEVLFRQTGELLDLIHIEAIAMAVVFFVLIYKIKAHPIIFLAASAVIGIIFM